MTKLRKEVATASAAFKKELPRWAVEMILARRKREAEE